MNTVVNFAAKRVVGNVAERVHKNPPPFETDPEVIAAAQEIAAKKKHHWYNKKVTATPDIILSHEDRKLLTKVKNRAWYLDKGFHCCCFQIGLDGLIGLIPGIGDFITTYMALQLVRTAAKANLPNSLLSRMVFNVFLDFMIGLTPIAGDILDILYKANWRNAMLLEEFLIMRRMDEIRLEKGAEVTLNDDHTVTTTVGALHDGRGETSNNKHNNKVIPSPVPNLESPVKKKDNPTVTHHEHQQGEVLANDDETQKKKNKYGTFFNWRS